MKNPTSQLAFGLAVSLATAFGQGTIVVGSVMPTFTLVAMPEPSMLALWSLAGVFALVMRKRTASGFSGINCN